MNFNAKAPRRSNTAKDKLAALSFNESSAPVRKMVQIGKSNVWIEPAGQYQKKKNSSSNVFLNIKKSEKGTYWPRLTKETGKLNYVGVDWGHYIEEDDEDEENKDSKRGNMQGKKSF